MYETVHTFFNNSRVNSKQTCNIKCALFQIFCNEQKFKPILDTYFKVQSPFFVKKY